MNRREMLTVAGLGVAGFATGTAFSAPACDKVSKDKAVRYAGLTIGYLRDILPLVSQLGGTDIAQLINRAIPLLEKLKDTLEQSDIPAAGNFFSNVTAILGQVANALMQLPDSARRNTIMGILTIVNVTMRTVSLFMSSEGGVEAVPGAGASGATAEAIRKAFEATRF